MNFLQKTALWNCSSVILHLTLCNSLAFVKTWPLRLPDCASVCFWQPFFFFFVTCLLASVLCWHGEQAAGSLHSNLPSFVITCPGDTDTHTHAHTHTNTHCCPLCEACQNWQHCGCCFAQAFFSFALGCHLWHYTRDSTVCSSYKQF